MKIILTLFLFLCLVSVGYGQNKSLVKYVGKYPDTFFKRELQLKATLKRLLGRNYQNFINNFAVQGAIGFDDGFLTMTGCASHWCGGRESILVVSQNGKELYCALLMEFFNKKFKIFTNNRSYIPSTFKNIIAIRERDIP
ncbi:MAG: hypothetical protein ACR2N3_14190 [Pyrinomonadaceae bacterium]